MNCYNFKIVCWKIASIGNIFFKSNKTIAVLLIVTKHMEMWNMSCCYYQFSACGIVILSRNSFFKGGSQLTCLNFNLSEFAPSMLSTCLTVHLPISLWHLPNSQLAAVFAGLIVNSPHCQLASHSIHVSIGSIG